MPANYKSKGPILFDAHANQNILPLTRRVAGLCYALFTLGCYLPLWPLFVVALGTKLYWQNRARGTWLESHFVWQKDTLLVALAVVVISLLMSTGMVGLIDLPEEYQFSLEKAARVLIIMTAIWLAFRMLKGWSRLHKYLPMSKPQPVTASKETASAVLDGTKSDTGSAARSFSSSMLIIMVVANLATLGWVWTSLGTLTGQGDNVMGLIYLLPWLGWAIIGSIVYGIIVVTYLISLPLASGNAGISKAKWLVPLVCLVMILLNTSILYLR